MEHPNGAPGKIIYLDACLIADVRLAREENWKQVTARGQQDFRCYQPGQADS
jgi:hypothetical protein